MGSHSHADHDHAPNHAVEHGPKRAAVADDCSSCAAHRPRPPVDGTSKWGLLSGIAPILACALCPLCLSAYATVLSAFGVGFALTEAEHKVLLLVAAAAAVLAAGWRTRVTGRYGPLGVTVLGCALLVLGDVMNENKALSMGGIVLLVAAMIWDRRAAKRARG